MGEAVDASIIKMLRDFRGYGQEREFPFASTVKRSRSPVSTDSQTSTSDDSTPAKRPKSSTQFDLSYVASPRETRRLRTDLVEARNTILTLESQIQKMHAAHKKMQIMFEDEIKVLRQQNEHSRKSVQELETQSQSLRKRESELKQQLADMTNKYHTTKVKKEEEIEELEKNLSEMKEESHVYDDEESTTVISLNRQLAEVEMLLTAAQEDAEAQKRLVFELEKRLAEKNNSERELEKKDHALQVARLRIKDLEYAKENFLEFQEQAKTQANKLAKYPEMEKEIEKLRGENVRLKDEIRNKLILEEEVHNLKTKLTGSKENEKKLAQLQAEQTQTKMYLDEWRAVARGICEITGSDSSLPQLLRCEVERLQHQEISLTSAKVELESRCNEALYEAKLSKNELERTNKLLSDFKATSDKKQELFNRLRKKLVLVSRERDSYRLQLDTYEKDLTMSVNQAPVSQSQIYKERIETLENMLKEYREYNAKLESELQSANPEVYEDFIPSKLEKVATLEKDLERIKMENEMLRKKCDTLEGQLEDHMVGLDNIQGQAFHMAKNPLTEALALRQELVEQLEQENEKLKRHIKKMEAGLEATRLGESTLNVQEVKDLQEQLQAKEAQKQHLKDIFKSSMNEIRQMIYLLFGYKLDKTLNEIYKLTSMYAESNEDQLFFQLNSEGTLSMLESDFTRTIQEMVDLHLGHQKSIPLFLSALTMNLFTNSTVVTASINISP